MQPSCWSSARQNPLGVLRPSCHIAGLGLGRWPVDSDPQIAGLCCMVPGGGEWVGAPQTISCRPWKGHIRNVDLALGVDGALQSSPWQHWREGIREAGLGPGEPLGGSRRVQVREQMGLPCGCENREGGARAREMGGRVLRARWGVWHGVWDWGWVGASQGGGREAVGPIPRDVLRFYTILFGGIAVLLPGCRRCMINTAIIKKKEMRRELEYFPTKNRT